MYPTRIRQCRCLTGSPHHPHSCVVVRRWLSQTTSHADGIAGALYLLEEPEHYSGVIVPVAAGRFCYQQAWVLHASCDTPLVWSPPPVQVLDCLYRFVQEQLGEHSDSL